MKSAIKKVHLKILFPCVYGLQFAKYYNWLMETQWLPTEELEEIQSERLHPIIEYMYENVPYYQKIMVCYQTISYISQR